MESESSGLRYKNLAKKLIEEAKDEEALLAGLTEPDAADPRSSVTGAAPRNFAPAYAPPSVRQLPPPPPGLPPHLLAVPPPPSGPRPSLTGSSLTGSNRGPIGPRPAAPPPNHAAVITAEPTVNRLPSPPSLPEEYSTTP